MPREMGYLVTNDERGETIVGTHQCCHCSRHWTAQPGSGKIRGFCMRCGKLTCGDPKCDACVPFEQWLENVEAGRPADYRPIIATSGWQPQVDHPLTLCSTG